MKRLIFALALGAKLSLFALTQVYFSPDDGLADRLISYIETENTSIKAAVYAFTNRPIIKALSEAKKRGVKVEIICDEFSMSDKSPLNSLKDQKIPLFVFNTKEKKNGWDPIMHHKFCLFENNSQGGKLIWTGSFNFTYKATKVNRENAIIMDDPSVYKQFSSEFEQLKKSCTKK